MLSSLFKLDKSWSPIRKLMMPNFNRIYKFILEWWNAILAGISLAAVAIFDLIPPLQQYTSISVFVAANAVVWTLIEIKIQLKPAEQKTVVYDNVRVARPSIIKDIEQRMKGSADDTPVELVLLGSKLRSMSDIIREIIDDMIHERANGHLSVKLFCVDPHYISHRVLPGQINRSNQLERNKQYASLVKTHVADLRRFVGPLTIRSSFKLSVLTYKEDPRCIAYIIGDDLVYWAGVTWSATTSEFIGTANPCMAVTSADPQFSALKMWLLNRMDLYSQEAKPTMLEEERSNLTVSKQALAAEDHENG